MNDNEKKKRLKQIKAEINDVYRAIGRKHYKARRLIFDAVQFAKRIGDRLLEVKALLLALVGHGHYEDWVEKNFDGGLSTARAYTRIAKAKNWKKIAPKLNDCGDMTIQAALNLLIERGPEEELDTRRENWIRELVNAFLRLIQKWPDKVLGRLAYDFMFLDRIEYAAKKRYKEIRQQQREEDKRPRNNGQPLYYFPPEMQRLVWDKVKNGKRLTHDEKEIFIGRAFFDPKSLKKSQRDVDEAVWEWRRAQKKKAKERARRQTRVFELN